MGSCNGGESKTQQSQPEKKSREIQARPKLSSLPAAKEKEFNEARAELEKAATKKFEGVRDFPNRFEVPEVPSDDPVEGIKSIQGLLNNPVDLMEKHGMPTEVTEAFKEAKPDQSIFETSTHAALKLLKGKELEAPVNKMVKCVAGEKGEVTEGQAKELYRESIFSYLKSYFDQFVEFIKDLLEKILKPLKDLVKKLHEKIEPDAKGQLQGQIDQIPDDDVKEELTADKLWEWTAEKHLQQVDDVPNETHTSLTSSLDKAHKGIEDNVVENTFAPWWQALSAGKGTVTPEALTKGLTNFDAETVTKMKEKLDVKSLGETGKGVSDNLLGLPERLTKKAAVPDLAGIGKTIIEEKTPEILKKVAMKKAQDASPLSGGGGGGGFGGF